MLGEALGWSIACSFCPPTAPAAPISEFIRPSAPSTRHRTQSVVSSPGRHEGGASAYGPSGNDGGRYGSSAGGSADMRSLGRREWSKYNRRAVALSPAATECYSANRQRVSFPSAWWTA